MADSIESAVGDLLHEPTQVEDDRVHLTVNEIYEVSEAGRIDFGGGELTDAGTTAHPRYWRDVDDDYQWWHLTAGQYLVEYNETLAVDEPVCLQPRRELLERGASHPSLRTTALHRMPLAVGGDGIHVKENARLSVVLRP